MTKLELKIIIRRIVKEEIYKELPDILKEVIGDMVSTKSSTLPKKSSPITTINEHSTMSKEQIRSMLRGNVQLEGGGFHMTTDDIPMLTEPLGSSGISADAYEEMMNMSNLPVATIPTSAIKDPALVRALTRNYSDLMKRLK